MTKTKTPEYRIAGALGKFRSNKSMVKEQFIHNALEIERQIDSCLIKHAGIHTNYYGNIADKNYYKTIFLGEKCLKCIRFIQENKNLKKDTEEKIREGIKRVLYNNETLKAVSNKIWKYGVDFGEIWPIVSPKIFTNVDQAINEGIIGAYTSKITYELNVEKTSNYMLIEYDCKPTTEDISVPKDFLKDTVRKYVKAIMHRKK